MEKRTVLAIALSFMVLFGYEVIFVAPKRAKLIKEQKEQHLVVNKEVADVIAAPAIAPLSSGSIPEKTTKTLEKPVEWDFGSTALPKKISNVGGSMQNLQNMTAHEIPLTHILAVQGYAQAPFTLVSQDVNKTVVAYQGDDVRIVKTFEKLDDFAIKARIDVIPRGKMSSLDNMSFNLFTIDSNSIDINANKRDTMLDEYSVYADGKVIRKGGAFKFSDKENKIGSAPVQWAAFRDHFTAVIIRPEFETKTYEVKHVTEKTLNVSVTPKEAVVANGSSYDFILYTGPQDVNKLKSYNRKLEKVVAFFNLTIMDWIAKAIFYTIPVVHSIVRSWGLSIIIISLLIYGITYPLTLKSMMSMKKMQLVQPKIKALQERYKSDPQKLNTEIMDIYKREKINPLGGCLPFLLQMPIFIALYQVLWRASYFQGKGFLWIKDLAQPDRLFIMPFSLPFLGNEFNILPILMAGVMFMQQRLSAQNTTVTDEQQAMQQKMMMYFFPVFIGFVFYKFAAGLSLYFTVFYLLSTLTQWKMNKVK